MKITRGLHIEWEEKTHGNTDGYAEAARFVGAYAGCVPSTKASKELRKTIPGYDDLDDDEIMEAYENALRVLTSRRP